MTASVARPVGRPLGRPEFVALIAAIMSLNALAIDIMLPALPAIGDALGVADPNDRQFVVSAYMIGFGLGQFAVGPLSDRFGRRAPLLAGIALYVAAAGLAAAAPGFAAMLALRFVQGLGAASTRVIATAVVRDRFEGAAMAEVMSLAFMVFMAVPIVAPGMGEVLLLAGPWQSIFAFMAGLALVVGAWALLRLPETLAPEGRRPLTAASVFGGFGLVFGNRMALFYALAGMCLFAALFGFISTSQQIYVDVFGLGQLFPLAFAAVAAVMAVSAFLNSRIVGRWGMRRISHGAVLAFTGFSAALLVLSLRGTPPLWVFLLLLGGAMFMFGWASANMNALSLQPLGAVAGTASSVFGSLQTLGGAVLGGLVGQRFDGTVVPTVGGYVLFGAAALLCVLAAERGRLFGPGG